MEDTEMMSADLTQHPIGLLYISELVLSYRPLIGQEEWSFVSWNAGISTLLPP